MANEGLYGLGDFTGVPFGQPENALIPGPPFGYYGLFDFTGIPIGIPVPIPGGKSPKIGGKRVYYHLIQMLRDRQLTANAIIKQSLTLMRQAQEAHAHASYLKHLYEIRVKNAKAAYSVLLAIA